MATVLPRLSNRDVKNISPAYYSAILALGDTADGAGIEKELRELSSLRASQINGCAYCVHYHLSLLRELGVSQVKIDLTVVWDESGIFSERECAAFAWTEALTLISDTRVPDDVYARVSAVFSDAELIALTASITTINVWNRLSIAFRFPPEV